MDRGDLQATRPWVYKESNMTEHAHMSISQIDHTLKDLKNFVGSIVLRRQVDSQFEFKTYK